MIERSLTVGLFFERKLFSSDISRRPHVAFTHMRGIIQTGISHCKGIMPVNLKVVHNPIRRFVILIDLISQKAGV
ncbi:hypothetical protein P692DRAFT_201585581 [Suillus brevipes Sb2]|nr:hypothetical protein P692DRAFT_201585581 [Suillus brevipes Sb2]